MDRSVAADAAASLAQRGTDWPFPPMPTHATATVVVHIAATRLSVARRYARGV